tara:strand:- start:17 stop:1114 length:1098 start_codon:yes stop_codon:yes gene_type:complete
MQLEKFVKPYKVPRKQRYWVVRADTGRYLANFRSAGCAAIAHLDQLKLGEQIERPFMPDAGDILKRLDSALKDEGKSTAQVTSAANQVSKFLYDMQPGDLVLSPGPDVISVGRITGYPRIIKRPVIVRDSLDSDHDIVMSHNLRRSVTWGPVIRRLNFPVSVTRSLKANQTIFNVDDHWEAIHHLIYPLFYKGRRTYVSFKVNQPKDVNNYLVARFLEFLSKTEAFSEFGFVEPHWNQGLFEREFLEYALSGRGTLTFKAQVMSQGDINSTFVGSAVEALKDALGAKDTKRIVYGLAIYAALFGNDVLGMDGIIDIETRHMIRDYVIENWEETVGDEIKEQLVLDMPSYDTAGIETKELDEQITD